MFDFVAVTDVQRSRGVLEQDAQTKNRCKRNGGLGEFGSAPLCRLLVNFQPK
jgi:hypothetical protein